MEHEEFQYLRALDTILKEPLKPNRTGVGSRSISGLHLKFTLMRGTDPILPLITTKFTSFKLILTELLWFIAGSTNSKTLNSMGNKIWNANGSRQFLDSRGFYNRPEGDLGPIYGFQWRHWNGDYSNPEPGGIDQLANTVASIKSDPFSRRHVITAWNPEQISDMALPPCHVLFQFIVQPNDAGQPAKLDLCLYQRSGDMPLGVPFNIASYSLLCHIVAGLCDLTPGAFSITIGDAHIYENQADLCRVQMSRQPYDFPLLHIDRADIDNLDVSDFSLTEYKHHPAIHYPFTA